MEGDEGFQLQWEEEVEVKHTIHKVQVHAQGEAHGEGPYIPEENYANMEFKISQPSEIIEDTDQMAAENLMYLAQDTMYCETVELDPNVECVTEEVITDDWAHGGQDRVEVPMDYLAMQSDHNLKLENDDDIPLPTDQDEYTAMRPWPCDFCSRRFRKKAALMNHMVAHQNDRPHACNLCGVRYVRKCDLMNHLKTHAYVPDDAIDFEDMLSNNQIVKPKKKRGRRKKISETVENDLWEHMTSARTQQWSRRARSPPRRTPPPPRDPSPLPSEHTPSPPPVPADPSRPFVCRQCGVGFAREKALQSHSRVHGGDSPIECYVCGELCWSRDALSQHTRNKHPHQPPRQVVKEPFNEDTDGDDDDNDMDYRLSPGAEAGSRAGSTERACAPPAPALFCQDCGVAFQRADLLRRHVSAAHRYKRHDSTSSNLGEHTCDVCGEVCADALQLLAHAERHADRHVPQTTRLKKTSRGRNHTSTSSNSKQFPCRECGKIFGSRSSQQIHVRIHTGERPYACRFCWKAFADGGTLRKHERIHTGEKPYACAVCPRAFNQRVVLREHVRSHHSAPERRGGGVVTYCCAVCGRALASAGELVAHLIQHCDANTAMKRQPQSGPRKYKRRRRMKMDTPSPTPDWASTKTEPDSPVGSPEAKQEPEETVPSPPPPPPVRSPPRRRTRRPLPAPLPRPKMIHTSAAPRPRTKQVRQRRPPRHPADDLRAIRPSLVPSRTPSPEPEGSSPARETPAEPVGPFTCEMCSLEFARRDALLLHVPIHI